MKIKHLFNVLLAFTCMLFITCASTKKSGGKNKGSSSSDSSVTVDGGSSKDSSADTSSSSQSDKDKSGKDDSSGQNEGSGDSTNKDKYSDNSEIDSLLKSIEKSRAAAEDADADIALPELYNSANEAFERLKKRAATEDTPELKRALENLNSLFKGLEAYADAKAKKERIDRKGYAFNNQNAYDEGAALLEELEEINKNASSFIAELEKGKSDNGNEFLKKANKAGSNFSNVFKTTATNERSAAFKAKKQADSVKASVSRKNDYDNGVGAFRDGDSKYVNGEVEESIEDYVYARGIFSKLYKEVSAVRQKTQALINSAKENVKHSESVALKADRTDPLTERIKGIEDENTVLLEADDFSAATASYVEVSEHLQLGGGKYL